MSTLRRAFNVARQLRATLPPSSGSACLASHAKFPARTKARKPLTAVFDSTATQLVKSGSACSLDARLARSSSAAGVFGTAFSSFPQGTSGYSFAAKNGGRSLLRDQRYKEAAVGRQVPSKGTVLNAGVGTFGGGWLISLLACTEAANSLISPVFLYTSRRTVARVRAHRFRGVVPVKVHAPKTEFYLRAEGQFLSERAQAPEGYVGNWIPDDCLKLDPQLRRCLHLRASSNRQVHRWRKLQLRRRFQRRPFDTGSPSVKIACLTEKILNLRAHLIRKPKDHSKKRIMSILLARRQKTMKFLYRSDSELYFAVCQQLRLKCVRFTVPDSRDRSRAINPLAIDGDRCKFLIRQKLWKGRYRPRPLKQQDGQTVRYTRHPIGQPPSDWSLPKEQKPIVSRAWPYGVKEERFKGTYVVHNPTAPGLGYCPVPMLS